MYISYIYIYVFPFSLYDKHARLGEEKILAVLSILFETMSCQRCCLAASDVEAAHISFMAALSWWTSSCVLPGHRHLETRENLEKTRVLA